MGELSKDQQIIFVAMIVVVIAAFVERYSGVQETASVEEIIAGAFVATALLLLLSYVQSEFAVGLAVIAALAMVIAKGKPFWDAISAVTGKSPGATPTSPQSPLAQQANLETQQNVAQGKLYSPTPLPQGG